MVDTEIFGLERDIQIDRTMIIQIPEIKSKTRCSYINDVPADVHEYSTEVAVTESWVQEAPDFKINVWPFPRLSAKTLTLITLSPAGLISAASFKSLTTFGKILTFTDGTYGSLKKVVFPVYTYDYAVALTGNIKGVATTYNIIIKSNGRPHMFDFRKFDIDGAALIIEIMFCSSKYAPDNYYDDDAANTSQVWTLEPITLLFDCYNSFDRFSTPSFAVSITEEALSGTAAQLSNYPFLSAHAQRIGLEPIQYLRLLAKALHLRDNKGYATLSNEISDTDKVKRLSNNILAILSSIISGMSSYDITIPEHFQQWIEEGHITQHNALIAAAVIAAVDDVVLETSM